MMILDAILLYSRRIYCQYVILHDLTPAFRMILSEKESLDKARLLLIAILQDLTPAFSDRRQHLCNQTGGKQYNKNC